MQDNLSNRIYDAKFGSGALYLSESEQTSLLTIIGKGCRNSTKDKLTRRIALPLSLWTDYGIFRRVTFENGEVDYICGQSWTDEMRTLRECVLDI